MALENVSVKTDKGKLIITCDIASKTIKNAPESKSQKTLLVSTTGGSMEIPGHDLKLQLNLMAPNPNRP